VPSGVLGHVLLVRVVLTEVEGSLSLEVPKESVEVPKGLRHEWTLGLV